MLLVLTGCTLVDQRSFRAEAPAPGQAELARTALPALPLITVRFDAPVDQAAIAGAVDLALARRPDAIFDVIAAIPGTASRAQQEAAMAQGRLDAEQVATALAQAGAARSRIEIGARGDSVPGLREIRVYLR